MRYKTFNLNQSIRVKLTDLGYQRLADLHNSYIGVIKNWEERNADYYKKKADNEGYTEFQAWEFIQKFGEVVRVAGPDYFSINVRFRESDLIIE